MTHCFLPASAFQITSFFSQSPCYTPTCLAKWESIPPFDIVVQKQISTKLNPTLINIPRYLETNNYNHILQFNDSMEHQFPRLVITKKGPGKTTPVGHLSTGFTQRPEPLLHRICWRSHPSGQVVVWIISPSKGKFSGRGEHLNKIFETTG